MKKYLEIYNYYKEQIETQQIIQGAKMPSIRKSTEIFNCSKTTIESAYFALAADGYIMSQPKSGFFVSKINVKETYKENISPEQKLIKYDFLNSNADKESFDFSLWQRYIKNALRQDDKLLSYGEAQGEEELRIAISNYIREKRNVVASPNRIVIGAGVQTLLHILCSIIKEKKSVSFPDKSFVSGASVFSDYGYEVHFRDKNAKIIYVSPSHMTRWGDVMPSHRRLELVNLAKKNNSLIIEDDYESDFLYNKTPAPSLHAIASGNNVVYIGSFSKLLLPSIRISFMVLTDDLYNTYVNNIHKYAQTSSKTEQIALSQFIRDGKLESQIRKIRRLYTEKTKQLQKSMSKYFDDTIIGENGLQLKINTPCSKTTDELQKELRQNSMCVYVDNANTKTAKLVLSSSNVSTKYFDECARILSNICSISPN